MASSQLVRYHGEVGGAANVRMCCRISCPSTGQVRVIPGFDNPRVFLQERVKELAMRQEAQVLLPDHHHRKARADLDLSKVLLDYPHGLDLVDLSYDRCREIFFNDKDPFNFGTLFMNPQKAKSIWALWAYGRRIDEMADGINGSFATHDSFDRLEKRIIDVYQGRPHDLLDVALADTVAKYPVDFQLFKDLIDGTRIDMTSMKFKNFDEVYLHRYYIGSSFFLQLIQVMGIAPKSTATIEAVYDGMVTLGNGLTIIDLLRDVGVDAKLGRIYLSRDELERAGLSEDDIFNGRVTNKWKNFMKEQIERARMLIDEGAKVIKELNEDVRLALWTAAFVYRKDLEVIEDNGYDCFTKKASAGNARKLATLPIAYAKSVGSNPFSNVIHKVKALV